MTSSSQIGFQVLLFGLAVLAGCASAPSGPPPKIVVLPSDVKIYDIPLDGPMALSPEKTAKVSLEADAAIRRYLMGKGGRRFQTRLPVLSEVDNATLEKQYAAYEPIAVALDNEGAVVQELGPGLTFLKERTGADYALVFFGADAQSTSGRSAMMALGIVAGAVGSQMQAGDNALYAGLIQLDSGQVVWLYKRSMVGSNFTNFQILDKLVSDMLNKYPSGDVDFEERRLT